jgi:hypothetical protein
MADDSPNALNGHRLSRRLGGCSSGELMLSSCNGSPGIDLLFRGDHPETALSSELQQTIDYAWRRHTLPGTYSLPAQPIEMRTGKPPPQGQNRPRSQPPGPKMWFLCRLPPGTYRVVGRADGGGSELVAGR